MRKNLRDKIELSVYNPDLIYVKVREKKGRLGRKSVRLVWFQ